MTITTPQTLAEDFGGLLKSLARDCRFGHCNHPECRSRVERVFRRLDAQRKKELAEERDRVEPDAGSGYTPEEMFAMWKDHMRDQRLFRRVRRRSRRVEIGGDKGRRASRDQGGPIVVILREDGHLDKAAMRERRWFGAPMYS